MKQIMRLLLVAVLLAACGGNGSIVNEPTATSTTSEPQWTTTDWREWYCSHLNQGDLPRAIWRQTKGWPDEKSFAGPVFFWVTNECPWELDSNVPLRHWLESYGFDPDYLNR